MKRNDFITALFLTFVISTLVANQASAQTQNPIEQIESQLSAPKVSVPEVKRFELENGLVVLILQRHEIPIVTVAITFKHAGSAYEPEEKAGLANITAELLDQGTKTRTASQIAEAIDFMGASLSSSLGDAEGRNGQDISSVSLSALKKDLEAGLELLADVTLNPTFAESELNRRKNQVISSIIADEDDPETVARNAFYEAVFSPHPYHRPTKGYKDTVSKISREDVVAFYDQHYRPNDAIIAVVGDVDSDEMLSKLKSRFANWQPKELVRPELPSTSRRKNRLLQLVDKEVTQSTIYIGNPAMSRNNPDFYAAILLDHVLGHDAISSRLGEKVRTEQGLAYAVGSVLRPFWHTGFFATYVQTRNEDAHKSIESILVEIKKLQTEPVIDEELKHAKSFFIGQFPLRFETNLDFADILIFIERHNFGMKYFTEFLDRIKAVTKDDIIRVANQYVDAENFVLVAVTKADEVKSNFGKFGEVTIK